MKTKKGFDFSVLMGAAFLMATSSIGPGFLTQTTVFTEQLLASFGFVILTSIILDIGSQLNVWRVIGISGKRGQDVANMVLPGLGYVVAALIVMGGLGFNIGNIAGAGMGFSVIFGMDTVTGATQAAGVVMIVLTLYVAVSSAPPVGEAVMKTFVPDVIDPLAIVTLVGGTVGGYITFSGGHRLVDAGVVGKEALPQITRSSVTGVCLTGVMRVFLFLATLGVVASGLQLDPANPPASVFKLAVGDIGYKVFGVVMWSAAISSVIGAAYTSVSFIRTFSPKIENNYRWFVIAFIVFSTVVFAFVGQPVKTLILVGTLNGLILPVTLLVMIIAAHKKSIVGDYKHPVWMSIFGVIVVIMTAYMGVLTIMKQLPKLFM